MDHVTFNNAGVHIHAVVDGPSDGRPVILLHGFPDFWYGWRKQIPALAAAGFRVIVPDQRGYNTSDKPPRAASYRMSSLVDDVLAIAWELRLDRFSVVGHDWGGAVAWELSIAHPEKIERLVILNMPHPAVMFRHLRTNPRQLARSAYMFFFQLPVAPEIALLSSGIRWLSGTSRSGTFSIRDLQHYRESWSVPGSPTAMLNWYRAAFRHPPPQVGTKVQVPTRILWGREDRFLLPELAPESLEYCDQAELLWFPNATHWLHIEEPRAINAELIEFLGRTSLTRV